MQKILLLVSLLVSLNAFAVPPHLLGVTLFNSENTSSLQTIPDPITYGGKDISRQRVAVAHDSLLSLQSTLVG